MLALFFFLYHLLLFTKQEIFAKTPLSHFVQHYETLNYAAKPKIYRRDAESSSDQTHFLEFTAHGRKFQLALRPDVKTIAPDAEILHGDGKRINFDRSSLLIGEVVGEPGSIVHGVLHENGLFTGKIHTKSGVYFIESAKRYFDSPSGFHSVIYKDEDVKYDFKFAEPKIAPLHKELDNRNDFNEKSFNTRNRRATTGDIKNNVCRLSMEADFTFLKYAKGEILAVGEILKHVQALNIIYGQTFNTSDAYFPYSLQFHVGLLQVHNEAQTPQALRRENIDSSTFLSLMSKKDYSTFCQALYFTHRDFAGGILGLAWIGYPEGRAGGMCDPRHGTNSYNTAIVTFTLQGRTSPPKVSEITFAHEVGHAFGAAHDEDDCVPGGESGNYIMYDKATSGDRIRNDRFSSCSIRQIKANVDAKRGNIIDLNAKSGSKVQPRLCLESYETMIKRGDTCGNGVVEGDEECDCGHEDQCRTFDLCCNWKTCKLHTGKSCSPSQGPCCNKTCQRTNEETICEYGNDCLEDARCPSLQERNDKGITHYKCPDRESREDGTECEGGALLCHKGLCSRSICTKHALTPCECKDAKEECHACCIENGVCRSAYKIDKMKRPTPYNYSVGSACANNTGYCDFFQYCQRVDLEGPLLQLFNLYFTEEGVRELTRKYWWAILLATLGLIAVIVLLVIYGARYTGTDIPDGVPAKPLPTFCCGSSDQSDGPPAVELREERADIREDRQL